MPVHLNQTRKEKRKKIREDKMSMPTEKKRKEKNIDNREDLLANLHQTSKKKQKEKKGFA